jgi:hypothetical protein
LPIVSDVEQYLRRYSKVFLALLLFRVLFVCVQSVHYCIIVSDSGHTHKHEVRTSALAVGKRYAVCLPANKERGLQPRKKAHNRHLRKGRMGERKTPAQRIADLEARATALKNRAAQLKAQQKTAYRKEDARRKIIIGGAMLAEMQADADFRAVVLKILKQRVTRDIDKKTIANLLNPPEQGATSG